MLTCIYTILGYTGGSQLKTTGSKMEEVKTTAPAPTTQTSVEDDMDDGPLNILGEKDVAPVGRSCAVCDLVINICTNT